MARHIAGESKADRKYRRIVEHNERIITKDLHLDLDKYYEEQYKRLGEKYRSITAKFSDKEQEEAEQIIKMIGKAGRPEDGKSYEDIAIALWGEKVAESKIDHLIYVSRMITFDYTYNRILEPGEENRRGFIFMPYVKQVKGVKMIFNAMISEEFRYEAAEKLGHAPRKLDRSDYIGHQEWEDIVKNLKGVNNKPVDQKYVNDVMSIVVKIRDVFSDCMRKREGIDEIEVVKRVLPEAITKPELRVKFSDAMYIVVKAMEHHGNNLGMEWKGNGLEMDWKGCHGYLEGR